MRVLLFNTLYYPKFVGGAEISVQLLAEGLVQQGHEVFVITLGDENKITRINGVAVIRIKQLNVFSQYDDKEHNRVQKALWILIDSCNFLYYAQLLGLIKRIKPDVVHTNNILGFSPFIWWIIKKLNIPLVHTMRDYYLICHRCNMFNNSANCDRLCKPCNITHQVKKRFISYPDMYVGVSNFILAKHSSFMNFSDRQNRTVVYNAVHIPDEQIDKISGSKITFGFMARVAEDKGVGYLVDQLTLLNSKFPNGFQLILAGKGKEDYIKSLEQKLKGIDYVFSGVMKPEEFYKKVDVAIVPSQWNEPFGRVAIEALAYGVPVCIADRGGLSEIYREDCSWLFKPGLRELSEILTDILENKSLIALKQKNARNYALSYAVEENIKNYVNVYQIVCREKDTFKKKDMAALIASKIINKKISRPKSADF